MITHTKAHTKAFVSLTLHFLEQYLYENFINSLLRENMSICKKMIVSPFGFEGRISVLIVRGPSRCLPLTLFQVIQKDVG